MQMDTRRLTVAADHLQTAYDEITRAQGRAEVSMAKEAVCQAMSHMDLVLNRLEAERTVHHRNDASRLNQQAYDAAHRAWQGIHDVTNDWPARHAEALSGVRDSILEAMQAVGEAIQLITDEESVHA